MGSEPKDYAWSRETLKARAQGILDTLKPMQDYGYPPVAKAMTDLLLLVHAMGETWPVDNEPPSIRWHWPCVLRHGGCEGQALLPQWCSTCQKPHDSESELKEACRLAPTCPPCELYQHDTSGQSPGFIRARARGVVVSRWFVGPLGAVGHCGRCDCCGESALLIGCRPDRCQHGDKPRTNCAGCSLPYER